MTILRHFDQFNRSGASLGADLWWDIETGDTWTLNGGYVSLGAVSNDHRAIHQIPALNVFSNFSVRTRFRLGPAATYVGVVALAPLEADTLSPRVQARWQGGPVTIEITGFPSQTSPVVPAIVQTNGTSQHEIRLECLFQNSIGGLPTYIFKAYIDEVLGVTTPPRTLPWWTTSTVYPGMIGRMQNLGIPSTQIVDFLHFETYDDGAVEADPAPTFTFAAAARTPITVLTETPVVSPATFPFPLQLVSVEVSSNPRRFLSDMGYETTSPRFTNARAAYACRWKGSTTNRDTFLTFFRARGAGRDQFNVTIPIAGIGTKTVVFADDELEFRVIGPNVHEIDFSLVEVI